MKRCIIALVLVLTVLFTAIPVATAAEAESSGSDEVVFAASGTQQKKPKSIRIAGSGYVAKGKKITLTAAVLPAGAPQDVKWSSSDKTIATVSAKGVVTGKKAGKAKITAVSMKNPKVKKSFTVTVKAKAVTKVTITGSVEELDLSGTKEVKLKAKTSPAGAASAVEWKSSDPGIATVSSKGVVTAVAKGTVTITARATDGSKKKASVTIKVIDSSDPIITGWHEEDGKTYYYDENGQMVTGWYRIDHQWYFFKPNGILLVHDPDIGEAYPVYQDEHVNIGNFKINPDGSYNLHGGFFTLNFGDWDDNWNWTGEPCKITWEGKSYEIRYITFDYYDTYIFITDMQTVQENTYYSFAGPSWERKGDEIIIHWDDEDWVVSQFEDQFTVEINHRKWPIEHWDGNG